MNRFPAEKIQHAMAVRGLDIGSLAVLAKLSEQTVARAHAGKEIRQSSWYAIYDALKSSEVLDGVPDLM